MDIDLIISVVIIVVFAALSFGTLMYHVGRKEGADKQRILGRLEKYTDLNSLPIDSSRRQYK